MVLPCCWTSEMKCLNIFLKCTLSVSVIFCLFLKPQRNFFILINFVCRVKKNVPFRSTKFPVGCRFLMYGKDFDADPLSAETAPPTFVSIKNGQVGEWMRWMGAKYVDFSQGWLVPLFHLPETMSIWISRFWVGPLDQELLDRARTLYGIWSGMWELLIY